MFCVNCGEEIQEGIEFCPECGTKQQGTPQPTPDINGYVNTASTYASTANGPVAQKKSFSALCIVGFLISIVSLFLYFFVGGFVGIVGIIVSVLGICNCQKKSKRGKGFAIAGIIIGAYVVIYDLVIAVGFGAFS